MRYFHLLLLVPLVSPASLWAQSPVTDLRVAIGEGGSGCIIESIGCGDTVVGELDILDCDTDSGFVVDFYGFQGRAGDRVEFDLLSSDLVPALVLLGPNDYSRVAGDQAGIGAVSLSATLPETSPEYAIAVSSLLTFDFGFYVLTMTCDTSTPPPPSPSTCVSDSETLCLVDDRFEVQVRWRTPQGTSGVGNAVELTGDTGYFWFFDRDNVEMVLKVLNACSFADRFWVFAGGLTNVEVDIFVTDTETGRTNTYRNPLNQPFLPIQDTNAFATCP